MTISTHLYSAVIIGTPDIELALKGGTITLDSGSAPHVTAPLEVVADASVLDALDPRLTPRVRIDVAAVFPFATQSRSFDLVLRDRDVPQKDGTVQLALASDEALLIDYAPLADDDTPWTLQGSLRDIVDYVLDVVIPGAALNPGPDADLTSYWDVQNQLSNPSVEGSLTPWTAGGNCSVFHSTAWVGAPAGTAACGFTSAAAGLLAVSPNVIGNGPAVSPGKTYTFSGYGRRNLAPARSMYAVIRWLDASGIPVAADVEGTHIALTDTDWTARPYITAECPPRATRAQVFFRVTGSTAAGEIGYIDAAMFNEGPLIPYHDGATADTAEYLYDWADDANASASTRTALIDSPDPDAYVWRAGQSALNFLSPLVQVVGLRLVCDEQRNWTLRDENFSAAGALSIRHGVNMIDGTDRISRDDGIWFDAAVTIYTWTDATGAQQERRDAYALATPHTLLRKFEKNTPYPGSGFSEYAVRRAQGRGREVTATVVSDWIANAEQAITVVLENAPTQVGATSQIQYDLSSDEMTVTTRTTDTPVGAIDLLVGTIDSLVGTIDSL